MSPTFDRVRALVRQDDWRASDHAIQRMAEQDIIGSELADRMEDGIVVEDYPSYHAGPCVLVLHYDERNLCTQSGASKRERIALPSSLLLIDRTRHAGTKITGRENHDRAPSRQAGP